MTTPPAESSWTEDLVLGLAEHLAARRGWAWRPDGPDYDAGEVGITVDGLVDDPDRMVALEAYEVDRGAFGLPVDLPVDPVGLQVTTRAAPGFRGSRILDDAVYEELEGARNLTLGGIRVAVVWRASAGGLGQDARGRRERVSNYYALAQRPTPHRPQ